MLPERLEELLVVLPERPDELPDPLERTLVVEEPDELTRLFTTVEPALRELDEVELLRLTELLLPAERLAELLELLPVERLTELLGVLEVLRLTELLEVLPVERLTELLGVLVVLRLTELLEVPVALRDEPVEVDAALVVLRAEVVEDWPVPLPVTLVLPALREETVVTFDASLF